MLKVAHRINTIEQLMLVPSHYGVEIDIRYHNDLLILHHDAFVNGVLFEDWLKYFKHKLIILNTKSEGMEEKILMLLHQFGIDNYFFLDLSLPFLIKYMLKGEKKIAIRFSEYEPLNLAMSFAGKIDWVWIDCFSKLPLNADNYNLLSKYFKICLVSPELQGRDISEIEKFKIIIANMKIDAVCTKYPELW